MLTEQERKWLTVRKKACARCGKVPFRCSQDQRNACYRAGFPLWDKTTVTFESYRDAAEFEARAKVIALHIDIEDVPCAHGMTMFCPAKHFKGKGCGDWCRMRMAHLQAEQEMNNERNHA
jgi:hypothetical protein